MSSALLTLYRSLTRHRLYAILNIGGLALGIAVFLVLFLFVRFERSYDRWLPGVDHLYVVEQTFHFPNVAETPVAATMAALLEQLRADDPPLRGTRVWSVDANVRHGENATAEKLALVDPGFFTLFRYRFLTGSPRVALADPDGVILGKAAAERYFAPGQALGSSLTLVIDGKTYSYRVTGVVEDAPVNTSFRPTMIVPLVASRFRGWAYDHWGSGQVATILVLAGPEAARALERRLPAFVARHARRDMGEDAAKKLTLSLLPLADLHLSLPSDRLLIATLVAVGLLTLAIAVFNYVNLATARAGLRAREVALRKVAGATRRMLMGQFLAEGVATTAVAMLIGLALTELALPWVNAASGAQVRLVYIGAGSVVPGALILTAALGLLAGCVPALLLSRFQPAAVLSLARAPGGGPTGRVARQALVVVQFAITIALAISTAVLVTQAQHLRRSDLGFERRGLLLISSFADAALDAAQRLRLGAMLRTLPGVTGMTQSDDAPAKQIALNISVVGKPGAINEPGAVGKLPTAHIVSVGPHFFEVYRARLLAGRVFDDRHPGDAHADTQYSTLITGEHGAVVTRLVAARLGFAEPDRAIGQPIQVGFDIKLRIIGVIDDIRFGSPREAKPGTVYLYYPNGPATQIAALRYAGTDPRLLASAAEAAWRTVAPAVPFAAVTADTQLNDLFYTADAQRARMFTIGAVLAMIIGCIGLYGLAAFDTARRIKEIGIRKALGASTAQVLRLLIGQFLKPVLLANLIAVPLAYLAMRHWLAGFDDRIALSPWLFVGGVVLTAAIAVLTILAQTWQVARSEPWRALRYE